MEESSRTFAGPTAVVAINPALPLDQPVKSLQRAHHLDNIWSAQVPGTRHERHPGGAVWRHVILAHRIHQPHRLSAKGANKPLQPLMIRYMESAPAKHTDNAPSRRSSMTNFTVHTPFKAAQTQDAPTLAGGPPGCRGLPGKPAFRSKSTAGYPPQLMSTIAAGARSTNLEGNNCRAPARGCRRSTPP